MNYFILKAPLLASIVVMSYACSGKTLELRHVKNFQNAYELRQEFLEYMVDLFKTEVFIETGTFEGYSVTHAADVFKEVHSVEIDPKLQRKNKNMWVTQFSNFLA